MSPKVADRLKPCRLCLSQTDVKVPIFDVEGAAKMNYFMKIMTCLSIMVSENDGLPEKICYMCSVKLDTLYEFRENARKNDCDLKNSYKNEEFVDKKTYQMGNGEAHLTFYDDSQRQEQSRELPVVNRSSPHLVYGDSSYGKKRTSDHRSYENVDPETLECAKILLDMRNIANRSIGNNCPPLIINSSLPKKKLQPQLVCANCKTDTTTIWRRGTEKEKLCNACGLYLKLHQFHRPISMRRDMIHKRRRRPEAGNRSNRSNSGNEENTPHLILAHLC